MKNLSSKKNEWKNSRIDSVSNVEKLEPDNMGLYVKEFLLPNLQQSYNHVKGYISNSTKKDIYTIKKQLADLIDNQDVVRISTNDNINSSDISRFGASYLIHESLNDIYLFSSVMKTKVSMSNSNPQILFKLTKLSRDVSNVQKEIKDSVEQLSRTSCLRL